MNHTKQETALANRFLTAYNRIHDSMKEAINNEHASFGYLLDKMLAKQLMKRKDYKFLESCRKLRNFVVHDKELYMAVPSIHVLERIERIANRLEKEPVVSDEFVQRVISIKASITMFDVMFIIEENSVTQFAVYDENENFLNLLTENVLTRWLAKHIVSNGQPDIANLTSTVGDALDLYNDETHWEFISRHMTIAAATAMFAEKPNLEALIITERGNETETPIGILSRSDALDMLDGKRDTQDSKQITVGD